MICGGATYWGFSLTGIFIAGCVLGSLFGFFVACLLASGKEEPKETEQAGKVRYI